MVKQVGNNSLHAVKTATANYVQEHGIESGKRKYSKKTPQITTKVTHAISRFFKKA